MRPAMSDQRPEVGDRSAVKTQLTSVLLDCPLIVLTSGCTGRQSAREIRSARADLRSGVTLVHQF
jgi:hypothetical protein